MTLSRVRDGYCIDANIAFAEMMGRPREQIIGRSIVDSGFWLHPQQREEIVERLIRGERIRDEEIEFSPSKKSTIRGQVSMELIEIGSEPCCITILRDVTRLKQTEQSLIESSEKLRAIIAASPAAITALDAEGTVQIWNPAAEKMYGWTADEVIGHKLPIVPGESHLQFLAFRERLLSGESIEPFEASRNHKDGSVLHSLVSLAPLRHSDGGVFGTLSIQLNITRRKLAEEALRQKTLELQIAKEAAEAATRAKSDFVANMSHEIRTPMNGILGMTELALSTDLSPEQREFLGLVKSSAESLMTTINDILDYSKIEAGKLILDPVRFELRETLHDTMKVMAITARQKGLALAWHVQSSIPTTLVGDFCRLRQVIVNLVGNAIKFTSEGEVVLSVSIAERSEQDLTLKFAVRDTGVGITRDKQETIFHAFEQADSSTARKYGGTGLGLAICMRILDLMGGRIWVESSPGEGSTFHFLAMFSLAGEEAEGFAQGDRPQPAPAAADLQPCGPMRILLAEDNIVNQKLVATILEKMGHAIVRAGTGIDAIARWEQEQFDLVFMDVQMPEMDGYEATRGIRAKEKQTGAHVPIIAMTANSMSGDRERCLDSGMDDYLSKPINKNELWRILTKFEPRRPCDRQSWTADSMSEER
jgi:PAS domain S-box-containing protein